MIQYLTAKLQNVLGLHFRNPVIFLLANVIVQKASEKKANKSLNVGLYEHIKL